MQLSFYLYLLIHLCIEIQVALSFYSLCVWASAIGRNTPWSSNADLLFSTIAMEEAAADGHSSGDIRNLHHLL